jgi:hypothetical protein
VQYEQATLFGGPVARRSDPETSWQAARSVDPLKLRATQREILWVLRNWGPLTDEEIAVLVGPDSQSPSGLRTRRRELVDAGLVVDTGRRRKSRSGRAMIVWAATDA